MADVADLARPELRAALDRVAQARYAEYLTAVEAVQFLFGAREARATAGAFLDVVLVLPPYLGVGSADFLQLDL